MTKPSKIWAWLALLLTPLLVLINLTIVDALVTPACEDKSTLLLLIGSIFSLALSLFLTCMAWRQWQKYDILPLPEDAPVSKSFLPATASVVALMSTLIIAAQWIPQWILSPCFA